MLAIPDDHKGFVVTAPLDFVQAFSQFGRPRSGIMVAAW